MMIELVCRYPKPISKDDEAKIKDELHIQSVIQGDNFNESIEREKAMKELNIALYEYGPFVFNSTDITGYNMIDKDHVCIRLAFGQVYVFKIPYPAWSILYEQVTGMSVKSFVNLEIILEEDEQSKPSENV